MNDLFNSSAKLAVEYRKIGDLIPYARNSKIHDQINVGEIASSILTYGWTLPVLINDKGVIIAGHGRVLAAEQLGIEDIPCIVLRGLSEQQENAYRIMDNRLAEKSAWDPEALAEELSILAKENSDLLLATGLTDEEIEGLLKNDPVLLSHDHWAQKSVVSGKTKKLPEKYGKNADSGALFDKFIIPPFSVLNTQSQYWQARKKSWTERIGDMAETRKGVLDSHENKSEIMQYIGDGASIFDPVLAELLCKWFALPGYRVFDPCAGGIFGYVASAVGLHFTGIELRPDQAKLNQERTASAGFNTVYYCDDGANMNKYIKPSSQDLIFVCPPYADQEVYSDLPGDLSNMSHPDFLKALRNILQGTYSRLRNNRFAIVVISEVRDEAGELIGLVPAAIDYMREAGYRYLNEIVLMQPVATMALRVARQFNAGRKSGRIHQNVLIFFKGDPSKIKETFGPVITEDDLTDEENG